MRSQKKEVSWCRLLGNAILYFLRCWKGFVYPMPFSQIYAQHKAILFQELTLFQEKMSSSFRLSKSYPQSKNRLSVVSARRKPAICYKMFLVMVFSCPPCVLDEYFSSDYWKLVRGLFAYVLLDLQDVSTSPRKHLKLLKPYYAASQLLIMWVIDNSSKRKKCTNRLLQWFNIHISWFYSCQKWYFIQYRSVAFMIML